MARTNSLTNFLTDVATAIKTKKGDNTAILASDFDTEILNLPSQGEYEEKVVNISQNGSQTITPGQDYDAISEITINTAVPQKQLQTKSYQFTQNATLQLTPDSDYDGFEQVNLAINVTDPEYNTNLALSEQILGPVILPYIELEYIKSTGTQYINTNIMPMDRLNFYIDFISHDNCDTSNFGTIFGSRQSYNTRGYQLTTFTPTTKAVKGHFLYGTTTGATESDVNNIRYDAGITKNQRCSIYTRNYVLVNGEGNDINLTGNLFTSSYPIYLFALNEVNNAYETGIVTLYNIKFYYDDRLIADFIPVKRKIDDEICLYDKVTETFFTNQGTGEFIAGPEKV